MSIDVSNLPIKPVPVRMRVLTRTVDVSFHQPGFHKWPEAPEEVSFLRNKHRHDFWVKVTVEVPHNERAVEFITLQNIAMAHFLSLAAKISHSGPGVGSTHDVDFGNQSCETLAEELGFALTKEGFMVYVVHVSEDDENGATLYFEMV